MPAPHPKEFRDDVVEVARRDDVPSASVAKDLGSPSRACGTGPRPWTSRTVSVRA